MLQFVILGNDETGKPVRIGDIERRSGLYILGKPGMGKSALIVNILNQDIQHGHGLFFLDPHGDAITDLLNRGDSGMIADTRLFDPEDEEFSFGINLLTCRNIKSLKERTDTYTRAYNVFFKLWEDQWGPWLQLILQNVLWAFIENQDYTLAEVPMFLNPRNTAFRNHIIDNIKYNSAVVDFWKYEFFERGEGVRREREQQERVDAALTRINTLLTHPYVRHIIGQKKTTVDFSEHLNSNAILLFKLSANLSPDIKRFIGTILISELLHAVRDRPENNRKQFCIFVDEFHNFTSNDDFMTMITEGRKFGVATTYAHVERYGQFSQNQKLLGATAATANKVFFQPIVHDAEELAPEFAKETTTTEMRLEPELVISQEPFWDLLRRGHTNTRIQELVRKHFQWMQDAFYTIQEHIDNIQINRMEYQNQASMYRDEASISGVEERQERSLNELMTRPGARANPVSLETLQNTEASLEQALSAHGLAQEQIKALQTQYDQIQLLRHFIQKINRYLIGVMQGRIEPVPREDHNNHSLSRQ